MRAADCDSCRSKSIAIAVLAASLVASLAVAIFYAYATHYNADLVAEFEGERAAYVGPAIAIRPFQPISNLTASASATHPIAPTNAPRADAQHAYNHNVTLAVMAALTVAKQDCDDASYHLQRRDLAEAEQDFLQLKHDYEGGNEFLSSKFYPPPFGCENCSAYYTQSHRLLMDEADWAEYGYRCTFDKHHGYDSGDCDTFGQLSSTVSSAQDAWRSEAVRWV